MEFFSFDILSWLIPSADAASLTNAGFWNASGGVNVGVATMWQSICTTLPFCGADPRLVPLLFACKLIRFIFTIISMIAVAMIIYAGLQLVLAQGAEDKISEAKKTVMWAIAGLVLSILTWMIVPYAMNLVNLLAGEGIFTLVPMQC